jgi:hypothetical protein
MRDLFWREKRSILRIWFRVDQLSVQVTPAKWLIDSTMTWNFFELREWLQAKSITALIPEVEVTKIASKMPSTPPLPPLRPFLRLQRQHG